MRQNDEVRLDVARRQSGRRPGEVAGADPQPLAPTGFDASIRPLSPSIIPILPAAILQPIAARAAKLCRRRRCPGGGSRHRRRWGLDRRHRHRVGRLDDRRRQIRVGRRLRAAYPAAGAASGPGPSRERISVSKIGAPPVVFPIAVAGRLRPLRAADLARLAAVGWQFGGGCRDEARSGRAVFPS